MGVMAVKKTSSKTAGSENESPQSVDEMSPELHNVVLVVRELLSTSDPQEAKAKHKVGRHVLDVRTAPGKYGKRGVEQLAKELGRGKAFLYACARVAECWSEGDLAELLERKGDKGLTLSFSHFVRLSLVRQAAVRQALVSEVLEKGLTVEETADLVKSKRVSRGKKSGSRLVAACSQKLLDAVVRLEEALVELEKDDALTPDVEVLMRAAESQRDAGSRCLQMAQRLESASKRVREQQEQPQSSEQQEHPQSEGETPSSPEPTADFLHVQKIDDPAEPQIEAPAAEQ
jgi:hypothetical protein